MSDVSYRQFADPGFGAGRRNWPAALGALRRLLADPDDTVQVFEIMRALNGKANLRGYRRLLKTGQGGRIAYERPELRLQLIDRSWLDRFAEGSVGAAYRAFVRQENLSAQELAEISLQRIGELEARHPHAWFARRTRDSHDIWHVLSGYGRDPLGEACLVAFSYAQTRGLGWLVIALGAALRTRSGTQPYLRAIWEGYRRGRAAVWLSGEDYELLLAEPLEAARRRLRLAPPAVYFSIPTESRG